MATREAYGAALARLGAADDRVVALDADVKNSTFSEKFEQQHPEALLSVLHRRAGDDRRGDGAGRARRDSVSVDVRRVPDARHDFIRMAAISSLNIKMAGSHAGVSIGEDGPSQMALEDLAMMRAQPNITVLYPCDAVSTERLVERMAYHGGPAYMRTSRPEDAGDLRTRRDVPDRRPQGAARERA